MLKYNSSTSNTAYPMGGTLYRRVKGKYVNADVPNAGPFYFRFKQKDGTIRACCLNTEDRKEAVWIANGILIGQQGDDDKAKDSQISIHEVWDRYEENALNLSNASLDNYKQIFTRFVEKAPGKVEYAEDVTIDLCREYASEVGAHKSTAKRDLIVLRSIWETVFWNRENPWNNGFKPKVKSRNPADHSRMIKLDEARRLRATILQEAEEWLAKDAKKRSKVMTHDLLLELYDAVAFGWHYGFRKGSWCNLKWKDFHLDEGWFLHVPPKTEKLRPDPLELPIVPEVAEILQRRKAEATSEWIFPNLHAQYIKRGKAVERKYGYQIRRSANRTGQIELARDEKKLFVKAQIEDDFHGRASMHGFRKSCTTNLSTMDGITPYLLHSILGWVGDEDGIENRYVMEQPMDKKRKLLEAIPILGNGELDDEEEADEKLNGEEVADEELADGELDDADLQIRIA